MARPGGPTLANSPASGRSADQEPGAGPSVSPTAPTAQRCAPQLQKPWADQTLIRVDFVSDSLWSISERCRVTPTNGPRLPRLRRRWTWREVVSPRMRPSKNRSVGTAASARRRPLKPFIATQPTPPARPNCAPPTRISALGFLNPRPCATRPSNRGDDLGLSACLSRRRGVGRTQ